MSPNESLPGIIVQINSSNKVSIKWEKDDEAKKKRFNIRIYHFPHTNENKPELLHKFKWLFHKQYNYTRDGFGQKYKLTFTRFESKYDYELVTWKIPDVKKETVFSQTQLLQLYEMAKKYMIRPKNNFVKSVWMYRNKSEKYFDEIFAEKNGIMETYIKAHVGDRSSPINGKIKGLFFAASVDPTTNKPYVKSMFGPKRYLVPTDLMLSTTPNMYFADFYCLRRAHYITLVITKESSETDVFCRENLLKLDPHDNPFLETKKTGTYVTKNINIDVFYTENIDLNTWNKSRNNCSYEENILPYNVYVSDTTRTIIKNPRCSWCNLK